MADDLRPIIRLLAIPFLILAWFTYIIQLVLFLIVCLTDLSPEAWEFDLPNFFTFISDWIKKGTDIL